MSRADDLETLQLTASHSDPVAIKRRYVRLALQTHPDKLGGNTHEFQLLVAAFERLQADKYWKGINRSDGHYDDDDMPQFGWHYRFFGAQKFSGKVVADVRNDFDREYKPWSSQTKEERDKIRTKTSNITLTGATRASGELVRAARRAASAMPSRGRVPSRAASTGGSILIIQAICGPAGPAKMHTNQS